MKRDTLVFLPGHTYKKLYTTISYEEYLHAIPVMNVLEVSSKSNLTIGRKLSAMFLTAAYHDRFVNVEACYQSSKVFQNGGPYLDLLFMNPFDVKRDTRLYQSGRLIGFRFQDEEWKGTDMGYFYDWLYIGALYRMPSMLAELLKYEGFMDMFFNPQYSRNTQAASCATARSLMEMGALDYAMKDRECFIETLGKYR